MTLVLGSIPIESNLKQLEIGRCTCIISLSFSFIDKLSKMAKVVYLYSSSKNAFQTLIACVSLQHHCWLQAYCCLSMSPSNWSICVCQFHRPHWPYWLCFFYSVPKSANCNPMECNSMKSHLHFLWYCVLALLTS